MINYNNRKFRIVHNSVNGQLDHDFTFHYYQKDNIVYSDYSGGNIKKGHLLGTVEANGRINMSYHQIDVNDHIKTGRCTSVPEIQDNGKIKLTENWQWTSGEGTAGTSILEEL
ncbi:n-acetylglutamate synthase [Negadavirga shengliensis]|uniref:N-acetylglutamate synthase n=1 Tax=Negadavirga shengliensis TaxID=1389218 RepID=A0ABV9T8I1_9BACT